MEVKINKEIRDYTENIFFGLSMRQFFFSVLACISAVLVYFSFKDVFGSDIASWLCIIVAIPFATMGFLKYNGMPAEKFLWAFIKYEFLVPKQLKFVSRNFYYEILKERKGGRNEDNNRVIQER